MKIKHLIIYIGIACTMLLASCRDKRVYDEFVHTPLAGWEKNDKLEFNTPSTLAQGNYSLLLQMRTDNSFPFKSVVMIVDGIIYPSQDTFSDTIPCNIADSRGNRMGHGINLYEYCFPIRDIQLQENDSLCIKVRHDMKREILPGISDVGIMIVKK